ncbi:hypothetical protein KR200_010396, partial [Drosophila serrata]
IMLQHPKAPQKSLAGPTYGVTILMLIIGQMQVIAIVEFKNLNEMLGARYGLNLVQFFISFMTIQMYGFFYRIIASKPTWVRLLAGGWTYEINTISIMKPTKHAPYLCLTISAVVTIISMVISVVYGCISMRHKRGLFVSGIFNATSGFLTGCVCPQISRHNVILWSERLFVLTCFGIILTVEMQRVLIELPIMVIYMLLSNVFVIIFGASVRRPHFYHEDAQGDFILIGQLYYLNFFALYMSYLWTLDLILELTEWKVSNKEIIALIKKVLM